MAFLRLLKFNAGIFLLSVLVSQTAAAGDGFVKNHGQFVDQSGTRNNEVLYLYTGSNGLHIQLRRNGYSYEVFSSPLPAFIAANSKQANILSSTSHSLSVKRIDVDFVNASSQLMIDEADPGAVSNFYNGQISFPEVPSYKKITYRNVYPNTDIEFILDDNPQKPLKYNIILRPGSNIVDLSFLIKGCDPVIVNEELQLLSPYASISESIPVSYYADAPSDKEKIKFELQQNQLSFAGNIDPQRTFIVDPVSTLLWSSYYGDNSNDAATAVGVDALSNYYLSGYTSSSSNIATNGTYQFTLAGSADIFLAKFSKDGVRQWGTYYGGPSVDISYVMYTLPDGTSYLAGATASTVDIASSGAQQPIYGGGINDALLAKFSTTGQRLWSTYYGGNGHDIAQAITVDKSGNVMISGHTESTNNIATPGAYKTVYNFNYDVCIAKFTSAGSLIWGTYYGDSGIDEAYGMTTDTMQNIYVTGGTTSISDIATTGAHQAFSGGANDGFIAKFDPTGTNLLWGTYYGGITSDFGTAIKVSPSGTIFVTGTATSSNNIATAGAYQPNQGSFDDAFIVAFNSVGTRLWGTYFGGEDVDYINDLQLAKNNDLLLCGATISSLNISTPGAYQPAVASIGYYDAFFAQYSTAGAKQLATYFGGEANESARGMVIDPQYHLLLGGETTSTANIATAASHMSVYAGNTDAFLARFCIPFKPSVSPARSGTYCPGAITLSAQPGYSNYLWSNGIKTNPMVVNIFALGNYTFNVSTADGPDCSGTSDTMYIKVISCVGIDERAGETSEGYIFPNPVTSKLYISNLSTEPGFYKIYSANGALLLEGETENENGIDTSELQNGIYFFRLNSENKSASYKFVKE